MFSRVGQGECPISVFTRRFYYKIYQGMKSVSRETVASSKGGQNCQAISSKLKKRQKRVPILAMHTTFIKNGGAMIIPQIIKIRRVSAWTHNRKNFKVILDGREMGVIHNGKEREIAVEPGIHKLSLKMGMLGSNVVDFEINDNNPILFECGLAKLTVWESIFPLFKMISQPNDFLWITQKSEIR